MSSVIQVVAQGVLTEDQTDALAAQPKVEKETTLSTVVSDANTDIESSFSLGDDDVEDDKTTEDDDEDLAADDIAEDAAEEEVPRQLQAGLFDEDEGREPNPPPSSQPLSASSRQPAARPSGAEEEASSCGSISSASKPVEARPFRVDETLFIFDWDDTVLPSTFLQRQGLRLDAASQPTPEQQEILAEVSSVAIRTFNAARKHGTVILITNAERGWIELSCQKFLPLVYPHLENLKLVSARTTFEGSQCVSPTEWKLRAFAVEIAKHFGAEALEDPCRRKNVLSLGDAMHEREAVLYATNGLPACATKSLKFCERPDVAQICKQHDLILSSFEQIVHHEGDLDLCIRCP